MNRLGQKFVDWLYLPTGYTNLISRLTGLLALLIVIFIWFYSHGGCEGYQMPYNIPTWRIGYQLLPVPLPPEPVNFFIFGLYILSALALLWGKRAALALYFHGSGNFLLLLKILAGSLLSLGDPDILFLLALAAGDSRYPVTPTRRLMQVAIVSCYLLGVLQKLSYPDFWQGYSFSSFFADGYAANNLVKPFFAALVLPLPAWAAFSWLVLALETALGLGLCFAKTRLATAIIGVLFHGGIMLTMEPLIAIFTIVMWTGYLAFFARPKGEAAPILTEEQARAGKLTTIFSALLIMLMILMPLRIYLPGGPDNQVLTLFDRTPWSYGMFIMRQKVEAVHLAVTEPTGVSHCIKATGVMLDCSTENDLIEAINYARKSYPGAAQARAETIITVNQRRSILKELLWKRPDGVSSGGYQQSVQVIDPTKMNDLIKSWHALAEDQRPL